MFGQSLRLKRKLPGFLLFLMRENNKKVSHKKRIQGVVVSDKMDKTVVIAVQRLKKHPKYKQRFKILKRFKAHDPQNQYKIGDKVVIEETRPLSREKRWRVIKKI